MSIRQAYEKDGVAGFYQKSADEYQNPHFDQIIDLLVKNEHRINYQKVLDFGAGGGEVTQVLQTLGYEGQIGVDPYTHSLFEKQTKLPCLPFSFEETIKGKLSQSLALNTPFTAIISSFAMHLCDEKQLYPLAFELFNLSPNIIIITPHKRPVLEVLPNVALLFSDFSLTERGKKVFLKSYTIIPF